MEPWIFQMCRQACRRQLIAWGVVVAGVLAFALASGRYIRNFVQGPYPFGVQELEQIADVDSAPRYFVSLNADKVVDTGVQEITTNTTNGVETSRYVSAGYYGVVMGERYLIVKSASKPAGKVEGELDTIPMDVGEKLFAGPDGREARNRCYPFYMDATGFRETGYWSAGVCAVLLLLAFFYGWRAWGRLRDVQTHPVVRRVNAWGDAMAISAEAEQQFTHAVRYKSRSVILTDKFAIDKAFFAFQLLRFEDLLWAYKKITRRTVYFVPVGKECTAELVFYGGNLSFSGKEKLVEEVLLFAANSAPWAVLGFSDEIKKMFSKQQAAFCQAVEARRQKLRSAAPQGA